MNLRSLHDGIIVQRLEESDERPGSITIPDSAREKPQPGQVLRYENLVRAGVMMLAIEAVISQIPGEKDAPMLQGGM